MNIRRTNMEGAVVYHYCNFQDSPQPLCGDFIASLVDQLQSQATLISPSLAKLYETRDRDDQASRSVELLMGPLKELTMTFKDVYLLVDALDEFDNEYIDDLTELISSIYQWSIPSLHTFITSQFQQLGIRVPLETLTEPENRLNLAGSSNNNESDIRVHIRSSLRESPKFNQRWAASRHNVLSEIEETLIYKSDGS